MYTLWNFKQLLIDKGWELSSGVGMEAFLHVLGNNADALVKECIDNVQNFI